MTPAARRLLAGLVAARVRFLVFGGHGLRLWFPEAMQGYDKRDVDLLLAEGELVRAVAVAQSLGWSVESWGQPWQEGWNEATLQGRWYVRAHTREEGAADFTFESPFFSVEAALREAVWREGLPVCPLSALWGVKLIKDADAARALAARLGLEVPPAAEALYRRHADRLP